MLAAKGIKFPDKFYHYHEKYTYSLASTLIFLN